MPHAASFSLSAPPDADEAILGDLERCDPAAHGLDAPSQGMEIFRMKAVPSIKGKANRFVFQGVGLIFDDREDRPSNGEERRNSLIFIGRNRDRAALNEAFRTR